MYTAWCLAQDNHTLPCDCHIYVSLCVIRYYGCGMLDPGALEGCHILDLGCGAGMDCYVLSQLVGADGHVTGIDMTDEQVT